MPCLSAAAYFPSASPPFVFVPIWFFQPVTPPPLPRTPLALLGPSLAVPTANGHALCGHLQCLLPYLITSWLLLQPEHIQTLDRRGVRYLPQLAFAMAPVAARELLASLQPPLSATQLDQVGFQMESPWYHAATRKWSWFNCPPLVGHEEERRSSKGNGCLRNFVVLTRLPIGHHKT